MENCWTEDKEDELIEMWRDRPCLFDVGSRGYSDRTAKTRAMEEIAKRLELSGR